MFFISLKFLRSNFVEKSDNYYSKNDLNNKEKHKSVEDNLPKFKYAFLNGITFKKEENDNCDYCDKSLQTKNNLVDSKHIKLDFDFIGSKDQTKDTSKKYFNSDEKNKEECNVCLGTDIKFDPMESIERNLELIKENYNSLQSCVSELKEQSKFYEYMVAMREYYRLIEYFCDNLYADLCFLPEIKAKAEGLFQVLMDDLKCIQYDYLYFKDKKNDFVELKKDFWCSLKKFESDFNDLKMIILPEN